MILPHFLRKIFKRSYAPSHDFWFATPGNATVAGVRVSEEDALKYLTVYACVSLISADLARLPLNLYRREADGGKQRITTHPIYDLLHTAPNPEMTSFLWRESGQSHLLLWGNHYSEIMRTPTGEIKELWPIPNPGAIQVERTGVNGNLLYKWRREDGREIVRTRDEILHIPGFGFNGIYGKSMIGMAREAIGLGLAVEDYGARYFGSGTHPAAVITSDMPLGENEKDWIDYLKKNYAGLGNSHQVMMLPPGMKHTSITIPPDDAQFLQTRDHQKTEICGMYHVPPHKIALHGSNSNYNNLEQENQSYVDSCLMHWVTRWEQSLMQQLLTSAERQSGLFLEFLVDGLLRGDTTARGQFYRELFNVGVLSINDIRARENLNPVQDGDQHFVPLNMLPLDQAGQLNQPQSTQDDQPPPKIAQPTEQKALPGPAAARSIIARDRISRNYYPLFEKAAGTIVTKEVNAVKKRVDKQRKLRNEPNFKRWLKEFYSRLPDYVMQEFYPVFRSFSEAILSESQDEIGVIADKDEFERFVRDYAERYAERHTDSSLNQLLALIDEDEEPLDAIETRIGEWNDTRPEKIARNEVTRNGAAIFQFVAFGAGLGVVWRIRGPETCPYCQSLSGRRIKKGESFADDGTEITPGGEQPMKINGIKTHPPLHRGCDCYLSVM